LNNYKLFVYGNICSNNNLFYTNVLTGATHKPRWWVTFLCTLFLLLSVYSYCKLCTDK